MKNSPHFFIASWIHRTILLILPVIFLTSCSGKEAAETTSAITPALTHAWTAEGIFASPESAIYDEARNVIYVSNVNGYTPNGLGYLSALSIDGEIIAEKWLEGVNAPTGMAIDGDMLYVADFDRVVEIDIETRAIRQIYDAPDENPGVNDLTLSPDGDLFVSASAANAIYKLEDKKLSTWVQSDELQYANGLHADSEGLLVAGFYLRRVDYVSGNIEKFGDDTLLADLESIKAAPGGGYFVTMIGVKPIMHVGATGQVATVLERPTFSADIELIPSLNLLIVPSGGDSVTAFEIN